MVLTSESEVQISVDKYRYVTAAGRPFTWFVNDQIEKWG